MTPTPRLSRAGGAPVSVSFEFFPPKTEEMERNLWTAVERLAPLRPSFVSVTYGAGGSTRERTHATVARILRETELKPAAHLTCVAASRDEIDTVVRGYHEVGVRHIVALRGDRRPGRATPTSPTRTAMPSPPISSAASARSAISKFRSPPIPSATRKARPGTSRSTSSNARSMPVRPGRSPSSSSTTISTDAYVERVRAAGIDIPIVPGILPVLGLNQVKNFAARTGATVRTGSPPASRASSTIRRRASSFPPPSPPSRRSIWWTAA